MRGWIAAAGLVVVLAGCSRGPTPVCPGITILADAATVTRFRDGAARDLSDVINAGELVDARVEKCGFEQGQIVTQVVLGVAASRGPADRARVAEFDYFVAVADLEFNVLAREPFHVRFDFNDSRQRLLRVEELEPRIPQPDPRAGSRYRILIGFQLTDEELAWNRRR